MSSEFAGPAYRIITKRLVLRCWQPDDAQKYHEVINENVEHLSKFLPWAAKYPQPLENDIEVLRGFRGKFDLGQDFIYGIFDIDESMVLGGTGLHPRLGPDAREIGYWIDRRYTAKGLATEVSAALTRVAFEIDHVERVEIHCAVENEHSAAVPRKLGYALDGILRQRSLLLDGLRHDLMVWSLLRSEYKNSPCATADIKAFDAIGRELI